MRSNSKAIFLILLSFAACSVAHREGKPPRDVNCTYILDDRGYVCEIENLKLFKDDDLLRFTGKQQPGQSNEHVSYLRIHSSESHIVPSENIFGYFTNLQHLDMKDVSVKKIDPIEFCTPLLSIVLSGNKVTKLKAGTFIECENLEVLDLSRNAIWDIEENTFSSLNALESLDMSSNKLETIARKTLKPLKKLKKLSLKANQFKEFVHNVFNDLFELRELDLSGNPLKRIDFRTFDFTIHVETLHLMGTEVKRLHPMTFKNLRRLRYLDISHNSLPHILNEIFSTNKEMVELRMDNCGIKSIGRQFFDKLNSLAKVSANGNRCVNGVFRGDVADIRPKFLSCFEAYDKRRELGQEGIHSGEEL